MDAEVARPGALVLLEGHPREQRVARPVRPTQALEGGAVVVAGVGGAVVEELDVVLLGALRRPARGRQGLELLVTRDRVVGAEEARRVQRPLLAVGLVVGGAL